MKILDMDFLKPVFNIGDKVLLREEIRNEPDTWLLDIPQGVLTITEISNRLGFPAYSVNNLPYLLHYTWLIKVEDGEHNDILKEEQYARDQQNASDSDDADMPVCGLQVREELGAAENEGEGVAE